MLWHLEANVDLVDVHTLAAKYSRLAAFPVTNACTRRAAACRWLASVASVFNATLPSGPAFIGTIVSVPHCAAQIH